MSNEPDNKLEQLIGRELRQLPDLQAPAGLVPRVRAIIEARANLRWYQRPWFAWPVSLRIASAVIMLAIIIAPGIWSDSVWTGLPDPLAHLGKSLASFSFPVEWLGTLSHALLLAAGTVNAAWVATGAALIVVMYLSCIALGTAWYRVAFNRR